MKLAVLFLTLYAILTSACYFPFNDARFANRTLLQEYLQDAAPDGTSGWSSLVIGKHAPLQPWPANNARGSPLVSIFYCFRDDLQRTRLRDFVNNAWQKWYAKIGDPSKANRHRLKGLVEFMRDGQPVFCRVPGTLDWNPKVPGQTLEIKLQESGRSGSEATTGFLRKSRSQYAGRHELIIFEKRNADTTLVDVAHEMGHVFGLIHEHQRDDRDDYVYFDCTKLTNYDTWKQFVNWRRQIFPDYPTIEELCDGDVAAMKLYGWTEPINWTKKFSDLWGAPQLQTHRSPYDYHSIMQYASFDTSVTNTDVTAATLVRWKNGRPADGSKPNAQNAELIPYNADVTDGDAEGIRAIYPW